MFHKTSVCVGQSDSENCASMAEADDNGFFINTGIWKETRQIVLSRA